MNQTERRDAQTDLRDERTADRTQASKAELVERIARTIRADGRIEPLKGLYLNRASVPTECVHGVTDISFCVIAQGRKEILLGHQRYQYDPAHYLLTTVELPVVSQIIEASNDRPYLSLRLHLDPSLVSSVMVEAGHVTRKNPPDVSAINVSPLDASLLDAALRLIRLLDAPNEAQFLAPMITREIVYRLLMGAQGDRLRHIAVLSAATYDIARAIERLRKEYDQPIRIESIARELGMSVSGFHHHFKTVTAMSPLQYQKRLRLQEARRLMLGEHLDAASAAYQVGYEDASHFNREYKRLFGLPPIRDVEQLRETARQTEGMGVA
jgi:AraC-like DNA-binding protein